MVGRDRWARRECRYGSPSGRALPAKEKMHWAIGTIRDGSSIDRGSVGRPYKKLT